jgi:hypothetical protein
MNWILDEVRESIKNKITVCESFMELCDEQIKNYKNRYETNRVGEAANHEYWRACKIRTAYEIKDLKEILQEIDVMMQEEIKQLDEADEDERENRADAYMGI